MPDVKKCAHPECNRTRELYSGGGWTTDGEGNVFCLEHSLNKNRELYSV